MTRKGRKQERKIVKIMCHPPQQDLGSALAYLAEQVAERYLRAEQQIPGDWRRWLSRRKYKGIKRRIAHER